MQSNHSNSEPNSEQLKEALFTSYVLGECNDTEKSEVEAAITADPALQAELDAIRATHAQVEGALASLPPLQLRPEQRAKLEAEISDAAIATSTSSNMKLQLAGTNQDQNTSREDETDSTYQLSIWTKRSTWFGIGSAALAACLMFVVALPLFVNPQNEDSNDVALETDGRDRVDSLGTPPPPSSSPIDELLASRGTRQDKSKVDGADSSGRETEAMLIEVPAADYAAERIDSFAEQPPITVAPSDNNERMGNNLGRRARGRAAAPGGGGLGGGGGGRGLGEMGGGHSGEPATGGALPRMQQREILAETDDAAIEVKEELARQSMEMEDLDLLRDFTEVKKSTDSAISTFSIDVDTASYALVRRLLQQNQLPTGDDIRIEEMLNYFPYDDPAPSPDSQHPMQITTEVAMCPWNPAHRLARVAMKATEIDMANRVGSNLVFLIDVSGSMRGSDRLPLLQKSMNMLTDELTADDRVAIVTYASGSQVVLPSTPASRKDVIQGSIEELQAGGSTHGSAGIQLAYDQASQHTIAGGNNRVIWATDGDLNVGITSDDALVDLIEEKRKQGTMLTVLGFGTGNLKDGKLEAISNAGNGTYAYIDSEKEAKRVLIDQIGGTLFTVAKDVKIQVEFNPEKVAEYRLIGYDNRRLANESFRNDAVDAGELGAGHHVTALYEIIPVDAFADADTDDPEDAQTEPQNEEGELFFNDPDHAEDLLAVRVRYKEPEGSTATEFFTTAVDDQQSFESASADFQFSAAIATFALALENDDKSNPATLRLARELAMPAAATDDTGYKSEFLSLIKIAERLRKAAGNITPSSTTDHGSND